MKRGVKFTKSSYLYVMCLQIETATASQLYFHNSIYLRYCLWNLQCFVKFSFSKTQTGVVYVSVCVARRTHRHTGTRRPFMLPIYISRINYRYNWGKLTLWRDDEDD